MPKQRTDRFDIAPPYALRTPQHSPAERFAAALSLRLRDVFHTATAGIPTPLKPVVVGATAAIIVGFVLDIGPWSTLSNRVLGPADAQEADLRATAAPSDLSVPSEADNAALRYFAREGDVDRLEAELRRLRALYPNWQPPRDLLDPQNEDVELQRVYDLVGTQQYDEARAALAERRLRDPAFEPPARLMDLLNLAEVRQALRSASDANDFAEVLAIAGENERILTCEDVDSIWRVAEAFAETGRPQRAFDAYAYVINTCAAEDGVRGASLQKAAETLDPSYVTSLFALGETGDGGNDLAAARLDIVRGAVARGGSEEGVEVPVEWLEVLAEFARSGERLEDAMLVGFYLFRQGNAAEAAQWFRFALDRGLGAEAAEAYIIALRATGSREDEFLAREVAYEWREQSPELMEAYLDAMSTILTADEMGETSIADVEQDAVNRFVPIVVQQRDPNGAQALGWYAFNTCQFIIAEEWFISSANWVPSEAAIFGLALTRLRLGDQVGFDEVVAEWGALYPAVAALRSGGDLDPEDPVTGDRDDPTEEVGVNRVICDPAERERLRELLAEQRERDRNRPDPVVFTEAGSLTAAPLRLNPRLQRRETRTRRDVPRRRPALGPRSDVRGLVTTVQASEEDVRRLLLPPPVDPSPQAPPVAAEPAVQQIAPVRESPVAADRARVTTVDDPDETTGITTVERRVRGGLPQPRTASVDQRVQEIVNRPSGRTTRSASSGASSAQAALSQRNFSRCLALTRGAMARGTISAADATARGFCLLELERPIEAMEAFRVARISRGLTSSVESDAVYGATLAATAANLTDEAALAAASGPMSRGRRTETQIGILTQRAVAANNAGRPWDTGHYLHQRNQIAPLQKDLLILQAFAHQNSGNRRAAERVFRAVDAAGRTPGSLGAVFGVEQLKLPPDQRASAAGSND